MSEAPPKRPRAVVQALAGLMGTLPGRAIVIGAAVRVVDFLVGIALGRLPAFLGVVDTIAAVAIVAAGLYFIARGLSLMRRRLLWRVRRKLYISYFFIGVIPALLLLGFSGLGGVLLFENFSNYMVGAELRSLSADVDGIARTAAAEIERAGGRDVRGILTRRVAEAAHDYPNISMAVVRLDRPCAVHEGTGAMADREPASIATAGRWLHVEAPQRIPDWIDCTGFRGVLAASPENQTLAERPVAGGVVADQISLVAAPPDTSLVVRAVAFPASAQPGYGVVADLAIDGGMRQRLREGIGVEVSGISNVSRNMGLLHTRTPAAEAPAVTQIASPPLPSFAFLEYHDWNTGQAGTLQTSNRLGISEIYDRIAAAPGLDSTRNVVIILLEFVGGLFLVIEVFALIAGLALARSITGSVHELFAGTERVRHGDFTHKIGVKVDDQLGELANSFNSMTASIEDLLVQAAEKKRLEEELRIAHEIQMSLLPQGPLQMPGLSVAALCVPAREVGGDYYDFLRLSENRLGLLIADVAGKGTSAALYMAELKGLMLSLSRIHSSPRELLIQANHLIAEHLDARSFITMTYAVVDLTAGTMTYARAGHTPLIHVPGLPGGDNAPRVAHIHVPDGLVLGLKIDNGEKFEQLLVEETIRLHPGDVYMFFTDGLSEAMNAQDDCFGDERLGHLVEDHAALPVTELRERVLREITAFVGDAPQHDDMTMILLKIDERRA